MKNGNIEFSALEYARELRALGVGQEQADVQARYLELLKGEIESNLATKHDFENVRMELKKDMRLNAYTIVASLAAIIFTMAKFGLLSIK